jgi:hypothetical protein
MIESCDQIFVLLQHWLVSFLPASWQPAAGVLLSVAAIVCLFPALFALTTVFERKGLARIQNRIGPNRVGPFGLLPANRRRHQVADQGRHRPVERRCGGAFSRAGAAGGHRLHGLCRAAHGAQHGAGGHGRRPALLLRHGRVHGAGGLHGRMVEPQQVFAAGRHARRGADDQLRGAAAAVQRDRW